MKQPIPKMRPLSFIAGLIFLLSQNMISCCAPAEDPPGFEWKLTFEDNFDNFDAGKWMTYFYTGRRTIWSNKELEWYKDENVKVEDGVLKLYAKKESIYGKDVESEKQFDFTSGLICSGQSFAQAYGKWEIKVRFPFKKGFWPAFFLVPKQNPTMPEVDVFEYFGVDEDRIYSTLHYGIGYPNFPGKTEPYYFKKTKEARGDFSDQWMVWTFECYPDKARWLLNGKVVMETTKGIPTAPLYMIANVAVKDWKENNFQVDETNLPYVMEIDYIKVYQLSPKQ